MALITYSKFNSYTASFPGILREQIFKGKHNSKDEK